MPLRLEILAEAGAEMVEAEAWFAERDPRVADRFTRELGETLAAIEDHPDRWAVYEGATRRKVMRRFKYGVVHLIDGDRVRVIALTHFHRRAGYWNDRL